MIILLLTACDRQGPGEPTLEDADPAGQVEEGTAPSAQTDSAEPVAPEPPAPVPHDEPDPDLLARGNYVVNVLGGCPDCHTPRDEHGMLMMGRPLAGNPCLFDMVPPRDNGQGCLAVPNLSNHATGIANRTDEQLIDLMQHGRRPDGTLLNPFMPYFIIANYSDEDIRAVVAYLRTLPGFDNRIPASEPPIAAPPEPVPTVDLTNVFTPEPGSPNYESAMRGRYIAANMGTCLECHSPPTNVEMLYGVDTARAFAGGRPFPLAAFGFPSPPFPDLLVSPNITSDTTGLAGWSAQQIIDSLRLGVQPNGSTICPPMPVGPMMAFAHLTDQDAQDIANYIQSLPPQVNETEDNCAMPGPPPGTSPGTGHGTGH